MGFVQIRQALALHTAYRASDYVRFFKLANGASYLVGCLAHLYFDKARYWALKLLTQKGSKGMMPLRHLADLVGCMHISQPFELRSWMLRTFIPASAGRDSPSTPLLHLAISISISLSPSGAHTDTQYISLSSSLCGSLCLLAPSLPPSTYASLACRQTPCS